MDWNTPLIVRQQKICTSLMAVQLECIRSFTRLFRAKTATGEGRRDRPVWCGFCWSGGACAAHDRGCRNHRPPPTHTLPKSPRVVSVIITIITLRLQEISTVASEENPGLSSTRRTHHHSKCWMSERGVTKEKNLILLKTTQILFI